MNFAFSIFVPSNAGYKINFEMLIIGTIFARLKRSPLIGMNLAYSKSMPSLSLSLCTVSTVTARDGLCSYFGQLA
jgi:hypothetical protein